MVKKLFSLYFRLVFSSAVTWTYYIINLLFFLFIFYAVSISGGFNNFYSVIDALAYVEMIIACYAFCMALVFARKKSVLEQICFVAREKSRIICAVSVMIAAWLIILIPIGFCVVLTIFRHTSGIFCLEVIFYTTLRWMVFLSFFVVMGFILGRAIKSSFVYLLSAPIAILFSNFNEVIFQRLCIETTGLQKYTTLLSIQHMYAQTMHLDYSAPNIDLFFISKIISCTLISVILIFILYLTYKNRRNLINYAVLGLLIFFFGLSSFFYTRLFPEQIDESSKLSFVDANYSGYEVSAYSADITLSDLFKVDCIVTVKGSADKTPLKMKLDKAIKIESISCNGKTLSYERIGDYISIDDPAVTESKLSDLEFSCSGRLYYCNETYYMTIFSTKDSAALPPGFAFLPMIDGDRGQKEYSIRVSSRSPVVSNLDTENQDGIYLLTGKSDYLCIFSGRFEERTENDVTVITAEDYNANYIEVLQWLKNAKCCDLNIGYRQDMTAIKPKKVIYISCFLYVMDTLGAPIYFDDCLIINHYA